jgi:hypothetical protein
VQLKATSNALDIDRIFAGIVGVNEVRTGDGLYKYYVGEYVSLSKAKEALLSIKKLGYEDAFIRNLYLLLTQ